LVLQGHYYATWQAGVDGGRPGCAEGAAGGEVGTGYEGGARCVAL